MVHQTNANSTQPLVVVDSRQPIKNAGTLTVPFKDRAENQLSGGRGRGMMGLLKVLKSENLSRSRRAVVLLFRLQANLKYPRVR